MNCQQAQLFVLSARKLSLFVPEALVMLRIKVGRHRDRLLEVNRLEYQGNHLGLYHFTEELHDLKCVE